MIEANSKAEAEKKLGKLLDIAATYKSYTWNDVLSNFVGALRGFEIYQRSKAEEIQHKKIPDIGKL